MLGDDAVRVAPEAVVGPCVVEVGGSGDGLLLGGEGDLVRAEWTDALGADRLRVIAEPSEGEVVADEVEGGPWSGDSLTIDEKGRVSTGGIGVVDQRAVGWPRGGETWCEAHVPEDVMGDVEGLGGGGEVLLCGGPLGVEDALDGRVHWLR